MSGKEKFLLGLIVVFLIYSGIKIANQEKSGPDYIAEPQQNVLSTQNIMMLDGKNGPVKVTLVAEYQITGVVKSKKNYTSDAAAEISPMDLALAWGNLNQKEIDQTISYSQSGRWYYYRLKESSTIDLTQVQAQSSNTHLIPADKKVLAQLNKIKKHDVVELRGYLVNVVSEKMQTPWVSSLTRVDTGNHACEIMVVTAVEKR